MAVLQGVTELFPVSSLGHAVILPRLLNWGIDLKAPDWLAYLVVMHLGTSIALFAFFWRDWLSFLRSLISASDSRAKADRQTFFFVILATIPAVLVGSLFRKLLGDAFAAPTIAAAAIPFPHTSTLWMRFPKLTPRVLRSPAQPSGTCFSRCGVCYGTLPTACKGLKTCFQEFFGELRTRVL